MVVHRLTSGGRFLKTITLSLFSHVKSTYPFPETVRTIRYVGFPCMVKYETMLSLGDWGQTVADFF